jgi:hypothetical protein
MNGAEPGGSGRVARLNLYGSPHAILRVWEPFDRACMEATLAQEGRYVLWRTNPHLSC